MANISCFIAPFEILSGFYLACFPVLFCSVLLEFRNTTLPIGPCCQWCRFFNCGFVRVCHWTSSICGSIMNAL